jgi:hypothetical protein
LILLQLERVYLEQAGATLIIPRVEFVVSSALGTTWRNSFGLMKELINRKQIKEESKC